MKNLIGKTCNIHIERKDKDKEPIEILKLLGYKNNTNKLFSVDEVLGIIESILKQKNKKDLFYTAKIIYINDTHIYFIDKFNDSYLYKLADIVEVSNIG